MSDEEESTESSEDEGGGGLFEEEEAIVDPDIGVSWLADSLPTKFFIKHFIRLQRIHQELTEQLGITTTSMTITKTPKAYS